MRAQCGLGIVYIQDSDFEIQSLLFSPLRPVVDRSFAVLERVMAMYLPKNPQLSTEDKLSIILAHQLGVKKQKNGRLHHRHRNTVMKLAKKYEQKAGRLSRAKEVRQQPTL